MTEKEGGGGGRSDSENAFVGVEKGLRKKVERSEGSLEVGSVAEKGKSGAE